MLGHSDYDCYGVTANQAKYSATCVGIHSRNSEVNKKRMPQPVLQLANSVEAILMSTHSIRLYDKIKPNSLKYLKIFVFLSYWKNFAIASG